MSDNDLYARVLIAAFVSPACYCSAVLSEPTKAVLPHFICRYLLIDSNASMPTAEREGVADDSTAETDLQVLQQPGCAHNDCEITQYERHTLAGVPVVHPRYLIIFAERFPSSFYCNSVRIDRNDVVSA